MLDCCVEGNVSPPVDCLLDVHCTTGGVNGEVFRDVVECKLLPQLVLLM